MQIYPYNYPLILTDDIFISNGGLTGTTLPAQRNAAYLIAEKQMTDYIGTFLLPTIVTGSQLYNPYIPLIATEYGYVSNIYNVRTTDQYGNEIRNFSGTNQYFLSSDTYGYIKSWEYAPLTCNPKEHFLEYSYQAGLPTGTSNNPALLLALSMAAQLTLNEMVFPFSNESTGDAGVEEYSQLQYREKRKPWKNTVFGASAKAAKIANLVDGAIVKARRPLILK